MSLAILYIIQGGQWKIKQNIDICTEFVKSAVAQKMILAIIRIGAVAGGLMKDMSCAAIVPIKR